jgi:hypothetical protein
VKKKKKKKSQKKKNFPIYSRLIVVNKQKKRKNFFFLLLISWKTTRGNFWNSLEKDPRISLLVSDWPTCNVKPLFIGYFFKPR